MPGTGVPVVSDWTKLLTDTLTVAGVSLVTSLLILAVAVFLGRRVQSSVERGLRRTRADLSTAILVGRTAYIAILAVAVVIVMGIFGLPPSALVATVGVVSLAISLSLQDVLRNMVAGLYLLVEKPFRIGDRVLIRTFEGVVESVDIRTTALRTPQGELVLVPNAILFSEVLVNRGPKVYTAPDAEDAGADEPGRV